MKKVITILIVILVLVFALLAFLGRDVERSAEKLFYKAMKARQQISENPDVAPPAIVNDVESNLKSIIERYPESDTAKNARMTLVEFYIEREKYKEALPLIDEIVKREKENAAALSKAIFYRGLCLERQGKWTLALIEYTRLQNEYKDTPVGLQIPLYIGNYYSQEGRYAEANTAYEQALVFYSNLTKEYEGKNLGYMAMTLLRETYVKLERYTKAGEVIQDIIDTYPAEQTFIQQLPHIELVYVTELKQPGKAVEIFKNILSKTKDVRIIQALQNKIAALKETKSE